MARNGKIARLPRDVRDSLNRRLEDGEQGDALLEWLNRLPAVQTLLARDFDGHPITKQNLSEWRVGGFAEWQSRQDALAQARDLSSDARELAHATDGRLADDLATLLTARYAAALASWNGEPSEPLRHEFAILHQLCHDLALLRRGDHSAARLKVDQDRRDREREKTDEEVLNHFATWAQDPKVRDWIRRDWPTAEERQAQLHQTFGLSPGPASPQPLSQTQSQPAPFEPDPSATWREPDPEPEPALESKPSAAPIPASSSSSSSPPAISTPLPFAPPPAPGQTQSDSVKPLGPTQPHAHPPGPEPETLTSAPDPCVPAPPCPPKTTPVLAPQPTTAARILPKTPNPYLAPYYARHGFPHNPPRPRTEESPPGMAQAPAP